MIDNSLATRDKIAIDCVIPINKWYSIRNCKKYNKCSHPALTKYWNDCFLAVWWVFVEVQISQLICHVNWLLDCWQSRWRNWHENRAKKAEEVGETKAWVKNAITDYKCLTKFFAYFVSVIECAQKLIAPIIHINDCRTKKSLQFLPWNKRNYNNYYYSRPCFTSIL